MVREKFTEIKPFIKKVKKEFPGVKIILFGSRASGDFLDSSDYDFLIVSEKFSGVNFFDRMGKFYDLWDLEKDIEPFCYTPKELELKKKEIGIVQTALKKGILLA